jgi:hypothetical protein
MWQVHVFFETVLLYMFQASISLSLSLITPLPFSLYHGATE